MRVYIQELALNTEIYQLLASFLIYSMIGWLVESTYLTVTERKITNTGYGKGPFCPIYGIGAVAGVMILSPLKNNIIALYLTGAILATAYEFMIGKAMLKVFGRLWWAYDNKPFNYKGIICLESTVAWGFYAVGIIKILNDKVLWLINIIPIHIGVPLCFATLFGILIDYTIQTKNQEIHLRDIFE